MSSHYGMRGHLGGLRLGGLSGGFGSSFNVGFENPAPSFPVSTSVAISEAQVTGTFAAQVPTLLNKAATYDVSGQFAAPVQYLANGAVVDGQAPAGGTSRGSNFQPDANVFNSPEAAVRVATNTATSDVANARDSNLDVPLDDAGFMIDGSGVVDQDSLVLVSARPKKMKWWHWALIGGAVLGGGYAVTRMIAR